MKNLASQSIVFILLILTVSSFAVSDANPLRTPTLKIITPQNNCVYPTGEVRLQFTPLETSGIYNFTSFAYCLDDQTAVSTDGNTLLKNLSAGSHTLIIYGNSTTGNYFYNNVLLEMVYFDVNYSSNWVIFLLSLSVFVMVLSLVLFVNRRQFGVRLRGKKNLFFWLGLSMIILASLLVVPLGLEMLTDYLFPHDTRGATEIYPVPFVFSGLAVIGVGLLFLAVGTKQLKIPKWRSARKKQ